MKTAIIGLPMVGKTSLFTILTGVHEAARVGSLEARVGITKVPDARVDALAKLYKPPKITTRRWSISTFPSISKEALRDPSYLASLRVADALAHVLRVFESDTVPHEKGSVDPMRDFEDVEVELILSDLVVVEKRMERAGQGPQEDQEPRNWIRSSQLLERLQGGARSQPLAARAGLHAGRREAHPRFPVSFAEADAVRAEPGRGGRAAGCTKSRRSIATARLAGGRTPAVTAICGKIEAELAELPPEEAKEYLASYGFKESGMERLIAATYALLGLMSFLTAGETEVRAWTIPMHSKAVNAAGAIHSDFEKKFIRAEVVNWQALHRSRRLPAFAKRDCCGSKGKEYIVKDGDVLVIRHS